MSSLNPIIFLLENESCSWPKLKDVGAKTEFNDILALHVSKNSSNPTLFLRQVTAWLAFT